MTTSLESSMATFHFASATAAVASATGFLINKLEDLSQPKLGILLCSNYRTGDNHMVKMAFGDLIDWPEHVHFGETSGKP